MHAFNDGAHALEGPQFGAKTMFRWVLQDASAHGRKLLRIKLGWATPFRHLSQGIDAAFIEQFLPRVHGLARHAHRKRHFGAALVRAKHSSSIDPLFCRLAHDRFRHVRILQYRYWRHSV
jgi:hypothetical protein